ncbi:hypothetical protein H2203_005099 [Taxawa tesnikishii (nom. ined.)]|nr:hypothetical protein H2203_005099 [Dothideales sp. JES 119]
MKDYDIDYSQNHQLISDQILQRNWRKKVDDPSEGSIRVDRWVDQKEWWGNVDAGWFYLKAAQPFRVIEKAKPVLVICALDSRNWLGGLRFGGVEFEKCGAP